MSGLRSPLERVKARIWVLRHILACRSESQTRSQTTSRFESAPVGDASSGITSSRRLARGDPWVVDGERMMRGQPQAHAGWRRALAPGRPFGHSSFDLPDRLEGTCRRNPSTKRPQNR
jgi:hypothetical protein